MGKFVEYYGNGLAGLPLADRATIANMAPEYGATCGLFPIDAETIRYLELTGRPPALIKLVEAYAKAQGMYHTADSPEAEYSDTLELDLSTVEPSLAGPRRPQDRVPLARFEEGVSDRPQRAAIGPARQDSRRPRRCRSSSGSPPREGGRRSALPSRRSQRQRQRRRRSRTARS